MKKGIYNHIIWREGNLIPQGLKEKDAVLDGLHNPADLQTFPLKDKTVYYNTPRY